MEFDFNPQITKSGYRIDILPGGKVFVDYHEVGLPQQIGTVIITTIADYIVVTGIGGKPSGN